MTVIAVARFSTLPERRPVAIEVAGQALILVRYGDQVSLLSGLCPHRGGRMADARVEGDRLICGSHGWDFRFTDGLSPTMPGDALERFDATVDRLRDAVIVDEAQVRRWAEQYVMPFDPDDLLG